MVKKFAAGPQMQPAIWFCGDPHGDFRRPIALALERKPDAVIFLGDLELPAPAEEVFYPLLRQGTIVRYIHGNHDSDHSESWRRISDGPLAPTLNLDGRVETIAGIRVAGLGGIFRGKIWYPPDPPAFRSYEKLERSLVPHWWTAQQRAQKALWAEQMKLVHRATIFPDVYERLAGMEADILVTHEAPGGPGMHKHGFEAIGELAQLLAVRRAYHGHHHTPQRYEVAPGKCEWIGVGFRQIVDLEGREIE